MFRTVKSIGDAEMKTADPCPDLDHRCGKNIKWGYCCYQKKCHPDGMCKLYHSFNKWYCRTGQGALHFPDDECCGQNACHKISDRNRSCTNENRICSLFPTSLN